MPDEGQQIVTKGSKEPATFQITAEQILLDAYEQKEKPLSAAKHEIADAQELLHYQSKVRVEYENALQRNKLDFPQWIRYAIWEYDQQHDAPRARSIFERALEVDSSNIKVWLGYVRAELRHKNLNHARNLLDRAVSILPRVDKLWFVYVQVEESLDNVRGCRAVFERWLQWNPPIAGWNAYINFEKRYKEYTRARAIYERLVQLQPEAVDFWIRWAKFEEEVPEDTGKNARDVYARAVSTLVNLFESNPGKYPIDDAIFVAWAAFETKMTEWDRAREIYKYGLQITPHLGESLLSRSYIEFEKQSGNKNSIEEAISTKRLAKYEETLGKNPRDYETWFAYLNLLEEINPADSSRLRESYNRATALFPPALTKTAEWRRYIYLWIRYAFYEELAGNMDAARAIYKRAIEVVPHSKFTFAKLWVFFANFELRHATDRNPMTARRILGQGIGKSRGGTPKLFKQYIELEIKLKEFDRCRTLYEKFILRFPSKSQTWIDFANFEELLGEEQRARAIFELAISSEDIVFDDPDKIWTSYISLEQSLGRTSNVLSIFDRIATTTGRIDIWKAYAEFAAGIDEENPANIGDAAAGRAVFEKAWNILETANQTVPLYELYTVWLDYEKQHGSSDEVDRLLKLNPKTTIRRRTLNDGTIEEYEDYVFANDKASKNFSSFFDMARKWTESREHGITS